MEFSEIFGIEIIKNGNESKKYEISKPLYKTTFFHPVIWMALINGINMAEKTTIPVTKQK